MKKILEDEGLLVMKRILNESDIRSKIIQETFYKEKWHGIIAATFNRITREELRWYPYKIEVSQQLKEN